MGNLCCYCCDSNSTNKIVFNEVNPEHIYIVKYLLKTLFDMNPTCIEIPYVLHRKRGKDHYFAILAYTNADDESMTLYVPTRYVIENLVRLYKKHNLECKLVSDQANGIMTFSCRITKDISAKAVVVSAPPLAEAYAAE